MRTANDRYHLIPDPPQIEYEPATLMLGGEVLAYLEINRKGDDLFDVEINEFINELEKRHIENPQVTNHLENSSSVMVGQIQLGLFNTKGILSDVQPLWDWLYRQTDGMLQIDEWGFFREHGIIQELDY